MALLVAVGKPQRRENIVAPGEQMVRDGTRDRVRSRMRSPALAENDASIRDSRVPVNGRAARLSLGAACSCCAPPGRMPCVLVELLFFSRSGQRRGRGSAARNHLSNFVEVAGANFTLVLGGGVAVLLARELGLLKLGIGGHATILVAARQLEHAVVQRMEAGQRDKLELVAHRAKLALELRDRGIVELLLPVERW